MTDINRQKAWEIDTELYSDLDTNSGLWCVFGNVRQLEAERSSASNSGFAYKNSMDQGQAKAYADELNQNKQLSATI